MTPPAPSLWDFSLALYSAPDVESICLRLQDDFQVNVNILLWCCWLEVRSIRLTPMRLEQACQRIDSWDQSVVAPLRHLRRDIKQHYLANDPQVEACRQAIKSAELAAEKVELDWLETLTDDWLVDTTPLPLGENSLRYLNALCVPQNLIEEMLAYLVGREIGSEY
ncbi:TIGR02444 family protein [Cellvibrio sp. PSBB006]|uniref:TIGR02444 family protein n=1 Tax=Cellvibrio sp. PSBB006 TaxID=1987723 RepID=UPI000B3B2EFB|nr:TIGR02444 family protein [Cellvibrio sp. PSBB006]ARU28817.1 TIGR02444 family protein [Cellvibrio sp. PSBB006]